MFMIDMHGTRASAVRRSNSRTLLARYCGSCIARPTRSNAAGSTASGAAAESLPGSWRESISIKPSRPLIGMRTRVPSRLINSASCGRQISVTVWPAARSLLANKEPYEAPSSKTLTGVGMEEFRNSGQDGSERRDVKPIAARGFGEQAGGPRYAGAMGRQWVISPMRAWRERGRPAL